MFTSLKTQMFVLLLISEKLSSVLGVSIILLLSEFLLSCLVYDTDIYSLFYLCGHCTLKQFCGLGSILLKQTMCAVALRVTHSILRKCRLIPA
jgi:hypothetical protein